MNSGYQILVSRTLKERQDYAQTIDHRYPEHYPVVLIPYEGTAHLPRPKYLIPRTASLYHVVNEIIRSLGLFSGTSSVYFYCYPLPFLSFCTTLLVSDHKALDHQLTMKDVFEQYSSDDHFLYLIYRVID